MREITVPISPGELLDKITILRIKSKRIDDPVKLRNVRRELDALQAAWSASGFSGAGTGTGIGIGIGIGIGTGTGLSPGAGTYAGSDTNTNTAAGTGTGGPGADLDADVDALMTVNERLWVIEDQIRDKERARSFDAEFIRLARAVYVENDARAAIKRRINAKLGSAIVEEKSYQDY